MLALAIGIHNFPEGLATFASTLSGMDIAIPIVIAIAIHNIPEGIAVSVPIYHATGNRKKSLLVFIPIRYGRTVGSPAWFSGTATILVRYNQRPFAGIRFRYHGLHRFRRTFARSRKIWTSPLGHRRSRLRHAPDGRKPVGIHVIFVPLIENHYM